MLKDITLGQYFPGDTPVHRLDPRTKLVCVILYFIALFTANGPCSVGLVFLTLAFAVGISRIRPGALVKGMKPLLFIVIFTAILNLFFTEGEVLFRWWIFRVTDQGVYRTVLMVLRIFLLVSSTFLLTYTTSPLQLESPRRGLRYRGPGQTGKSAAADTGASFRERLSSGR